MSIFSSIFGINAQQSDKIEILDAINFKEAIIEKDVQLIDVRTVREFNSGHIEGAINVDFFLRNNFLKYFKTLDKDKPIYLYCRSGVRSQNSAKVLVQLGFNEIYDLKGGILAWK